MTGVTDIDDIGKRINKSLPLDKIRNKQEYKEELNTLLDRWTTPKDSRPQNLKKLADVLYEETAKDQIEANNEKYVQLAKNFEARRPKRSRLADERRTAKDTRPITKRTYRTWRRGGFKRFDLNKIDTKKGIRTVRSIQGKRIVTRRYKILTPLGKKRLVNKYNKTHKE